MTGVTTAPFNRAITFALDLNTGYVTAAGNGATVGQNASGVVDAANDLWKYGFSGGVARSATQRPIPYPQLLSVYEPVSASAPALQYAYDTLGRVEYAADATALQWKSRYPYSFFIADAGHADRLDPQGGDYGLWFNPDGDMVETVNEVHQQTTSAYDGRHRVVSRLYPEGDQDQFGYDANDNVVSLTKLAKPGSGLANLSITASYDPTWNKLAAITDAMGNTTNLSYVAAGGYGASLLQQALRPAVGGSRPTYASNTSGLLAKEIDSVGVTTTHAYDATGDLTSTTVGAAAVGSNPALNLTTTYAYDSVGNQTGATDPRSNTVSTQYDVMRRKIAQQSHTGSASGPNLTATQSTYDANGRQVTDQRATGFQSAAPYTATGWQVRSTSYTPTGNVASTTDPLGNVTYTHYDGLDRVFQVIDPTGLVDETDYDAAGEVVAEKKAVGTPLAQTYASYTWSPDGNRLTETDARSNTVTLGYDGFNRRSATTFPDSSAETAAYDPNGDMTIWTNRGGWRPT